MQPMETIHQISCQPDLVKNFYLLTADFIMAFWRSSSEEKPRMMAEAPESMPKREFKPYLAAMAHRLANKSKLKPPEWVFHPSCYLPSDQPFFGSQARGKLRLWFLFNSPAEFKHRNLFVDEFEMERI